jgi:glycerol-3-phosphate dehydrogenase (NAD(P)+)
VADKDLVLVVVPSHVMRTVTEQMGAFLDSKTLLVTASKGSKTRPT